MKAPRGKSAGRHWRDALAVVRTIRDSGSRPKFLVTWYTPEEAVRSGDPGLLDFIRAMFMAAHGGQAAALTDRGCTFCGEPWSRQRSPARLVTAQLLAAPPASSFVLVSALCVRCVVEASRDRNAAESRILGTLGCGTGHAVPLCAEGHA